MQAAGGTLKRITLELGGNDPAIILADADIATTAAGIHAGIFTNAGQICGVVKRVYVHDSIYADFCQELGRLNAANVVGHGLGHATARTEERSVGKTCASTCRSRGSPAH